MSSSRDVVSSSTRRGFLTTTTALATTVIGTTQSVSPVSGAKSDYPIGLPLEKRWTTGFAGSEGFGFPDVQPGTISNDVLYLNLGPTDHDPAKIVAYDIQTDSKIWETTATEYVSPPVVVDDTLLVSVVSHLKAYPASEESKSTLWEYESDMDIVSWPFRLQDSFVVPEYNAKPLQGGEKDYTYSDGRLSLYSRDGTRQWSVNGNHIESPLLYDDSIIHYEGSQDRVDGEYHVTSGHVVSRNFETGEKQWESPDFNIYGIRSTPTEIVLAHSRKDAVRGINTQTGNVSWTVETETGVEDYAAGPDHAYIGVGSDLRAVNYTTGETVWSQTGLNPYDVLYYGGLVFVGAYEGKFYALDAETGEAVWEEAHSRGNGFIRLHDGNVFTFSQNWVSAYIGKQGKARSALRDARSTDGLGTVTSEVADLLGRDRALSQAQTAIENQQYDSALSAINSANRRKSAVEATATLISGGTVYGGARTAGKRIQRKRLEKTLAKTNELYPLRSGALEGLLPENLIEQGSAVRDGFDQGRWGPSLSDLLTRTDDYEELIDLLNQINQLHGDLVELSERLEKYRDEINIQSWKKLFEKKFDGHLDGIDELLARCNQAVNLTAEYCDVQQSVSSKIFDLSSLAAMVDAAQSPTSDDHPPVEFIQEVLEALGTYTVVQNELAQYDLSEIRNHLQNGLDTDSSNYRSLERDFENLAQLLTLAKQSENDRSTVDFSHSDFTSNEIQQWIQNALFTVSLEEMKQIRSTVQNLKRGIWKTEHLHAYSPYEFEHLIADLYSDLGYRTQVMEKGSDGGIDVIAHGAGEKIIIQVKQYSPGNKIGRPTVQQTAGVREQFGANKAVVVTSSGFTGTAQQASQDYGHRMDLIDAQTLKKMLSESSLIPPVQNHTGYQRQKQRQQNEYYNHSQSRNQDQTSGRQQNPGVHCMICGNHFQSELETVETPDGDTIRCCPRCKQLMEETTGNRGYAQEEALKILGLNPGASDDEIKQAYRKIVTEVHPDQGGSQEEFRQVQKAYEALQ